MCGITGAVWTDPAKGPGAGDAPADDRRARAIVGRTTAAYQSDLAAGGPAAGVALGHRRLAIIDVAGGHSRCRNEDGSVWLVFNGEIYNYPRAARAGWKARGHRFRTDQRHRNARASLRGRGPDFPAHLNGMFALAFWDARRRQLLLARDRLGKKPLVYRARAGPAAVCQRVEEPAGGAGRAARDRPAVARRLSDLSIRAASADDFSRHRQASAGPLRPLSRRPAEGAPLLEPRFRPSRTIRPLAGVRRRAAQPADRSRVELRLQSEVPLGAFLSGGVDSTIIVGLMRRWPAGRCGRSPSAFPCPSTTKPATPGWWPGDFGTEHEEFHVRPDALDDPAQVGLALRRAVCRQFGRADVVPVGS